MHNNIFWQSTGSIEGAHQRDEEIQNGDEVLAVNAVDAPLLIDPRRSELKKTMDHVKNLAQLLLLSDLRLRHLGNFYFDIPEFLCQREPSQ